jgi:opacity protein-like surface antigen
MRRSLTTAFAAATLIAAPAAAQVAGLPVFNSGINSGITLNADLGLPNQDAGKGKTWAGTGSIGAGPLGFSATVASFKPEGANSQTWLGATANLKLFGGPLIPVSINAQAGAGYGVDKGAGPGGTDLKQLNIPVGIGIAVNVPTPGLSIRPWIAPRLQYMRTSGGLDNHTTKFGMSAGVNLGLVGGIQARIAYDYLKVDALKPSTFSVGLGYNFNIPVVPGI